MKIKFIVSIVVLVLLSVFCCNVIYASNEETENSENIKYTDEEDADFELEEYNINVNKVEDYMDLESEEYSNINEDKIENGNVEYTYEEKPDFEIEDIKLEEKAEYQDDNLPDNNLSNNNFLQTSIISIIIILIIGLSIIIAILLRKIKTKK